MALIRLPSMSVFERSLSGPLGRFTLPPGDAALWLDLSRRHVHQLIRVNALDAVIIANQHVYLDPAQVAKYTSEVREASKATRKRLKRAWIEDRAAAASYELDQLVAATVRATGNPMSHAN